MSILTEGEILVANLKGEISKEAVNYMTKSEALKRLRDKTGLDLGEDPDIWSNWLEKNTDELINKKFDLEI